jgi:hypothetical protein
VRLDSRQLARAASSPSLPQFAAATAASHGVNRSPPDATTASLVVTGAQPMTRAAPTRAGANLVTAEPFICPWQVIEATVPKQLSYGIRTAVPDSGDVLYTKCE